MVRFFGSPSYYFDGLPAVGILFLRLFAGLAMMFHGMPKMFTPGNNFGFNWMGPQAPVPGILQFLAAASEFFGGLALVFGLLTPLACLGIMSTMFVATWMHLTNDATPTYFVKNAPPTAPGDSVESSIGYFTMALTILLTGPGVLSLDRQLFGRKK